MNTTDFDDRFVTLKDGLIVPVPAYLLLLSLEQRGITIRDNDNELVVGPRELLTDTDRAGFKRWKWHLLMLLNHCTRPNDTHLFRDDQPMALRRRA